MSPALATAPASVLDDRHYQVLRSFELEWRHGEPSVERYWRRNGGEASISVLAALVKADMGCRFARGQRPSVADYLERFPALRARDERVLSLIYEEFCLREERGERPDVERFCASYAPWRDSLVSQLRYHRLISAVVGTAEPSPRYPEPGEYFEEFLLESLLGQGGAGRVYLARDESLAGRKVALKVSPDRGREPSILARLDHEHIVPIHSVVFQTGTGLRGLCMPYRPGLPLDEAIRRIAPATGPQEASILREVVLATCSEADRAAEAARPAWHGFPASGTYAEGVAWLGTTLAEALAYAHAQGILHRDVKPANVLLTLRDGPQLLDFNLACDPDSPDQAAAALRGGTLPYMAPEQLEAFLDPSRWGCVGASADLYSLGLLLRELLTGRPPETPDPTLPLPRAIRDLLDRRLRDPDPIRRRNPSIPYALEAIVARCLETEPSARYPEARALADDLERFLDRRPLRHAANPSIGERLGNRVRRNRREIVASGLVFAVLLAASAGSVVRAFVPIEDRAEFREAVDAIDRGQSDEAVGPLKDLVAGSPESPLARLYLALALEHSNREAASHQFAKMLERPEAEGALLVWQGKHPQVDAQLEGLGFTLYGENADLAGRAFRAALRHEPTLVRAREGEALVLEVFRRFPEALALLDQLITEAERRNAGEDRDHLIDWYRARARVAVQQAEVLQGVDAPPAVDEAETLCGRAMADLDRGAALFDHRDRARLNLSELVRVQALIALGEVDAWHARRSEALRNFAEAQRSLDRVRPESPAQHRDVLKLAQKLEASRGRLERRGASALVQDAEGLDDRSR